ncbi:beat protein [Holotrichia oblita]|uniref:Beat protein n=1 Tax=Holotrichia oblita TaxID=644536 RepID=A0ACB9TQT1_HOLOL|nr:beat protein [Holotrichia oblita]
MYKKRYGNKNLFPNALLLFIYLQTDLKLYVNLFQLSRSNSREVTLTGVDRKTSGEFKCEVSADAPLFHTEIRAAHLLVAGMYFILDCNAIHISWDSAPTKLISRSLNEELRNKDQEKENTVAFKSSEKICYRCKNKSHMSINCPNKDNKTEGNCFKCGNKGHYAGACRNGSQPNDFQCNICKKNNHAEEKCFFFLGKSSKNRIAFFGEKEKTSLKEMVRPRNSTEILKIIETYEALPGLETIRSIYTMHVHQSMFKSGKIKLRCLATMFTLYRRTKEIELQEDAPLLALVMEPTPHSNKGKKSEKNVRALTEWKMDGKRATGRPRMRWIDDVEDDLKKMGIKDEWKTMVHDRKEWRGIAMKAKEIA